MTLFINTLPEPEFKKLIYNNLIESFNLSYSNIMNLYLVNEIKNKTNILINNKLDIFINYFSQKLQSEYEYFKFFLENKIKGLGISSKKAIINLFKKIQKKINESIIYIMEDEIFYYIDIFFRENKNILTYTK